MTTSRRMLTDLGRRTAFLAGRRVEIPEQHAGQPRKLLGELREIRERFAAGKAVRRLTQGDLFRVVTECRVEGEPLRTVDDVDLVTATVERGQLRQQLAGRWAEWGARLDAPVPPAGATPEPEMWAGRLLDEAVDALEWERRRWPELRATLSVVLPSAPRAVDARALGGLADIVEQAAAVSTMDRLAAERDAMTAWLRQVTADPAAAPVLRVLSAAWAAEDDLRLGRLRGRDPSTVDDPAGRDPLRRPARPALRGGARSGRPPSTAARHAAGGEEALRAWRWRQAQTWFDELWTGRGRGHRRPRPPAGARPRPGPPAHRPTWSSPRRGWRSR